ncbi:MAG: Xaa-Pro peptidase family protein [Firmicutes bacterium]|nr:Xaa-Pro peptidase family protein [Bacillota bacterium]
MTRTALARFQERLTAEGLDGALIAAPEALSSTNLRYLSGFTGSSAYLLITPAHAWLLTDFRYLEQARIESPAYDVIRQGKRVADTVADLCQSAHVARLGFEADKVPYAMWKGWRERIPVIWRPLNQLVEKLRVVKSDEEIQYIRQAAHIADEALREVLPTAVGRSERDLALALEWAMRRRGAESLAFDTIVAAGERGAWPHARPSDRIIQPGELLTIDFGAQFHGYKSDETVTVATGSLSPELRRLVEIVAEAQAEGIEAVRPGNTARAVDAAARAVIEKAGYAEAFGHGTGHGVGLDIHEAPYASPDPANDVTLEPGMTLTVEPGIYLPGVGGCRLEDTLVITETGAERLTEWPKTFQILG